MENFEKPELDPVHLAGWYSVLCYQSIYHDQSYHSSFEPFSRKQLG
jgi:hypothetical protein